MSGDVSSTAADVHCHVHLTLNVQNAVRQPVANFLLQVVEVRDVGRLKKAKSSLLRRKNASIFHFHHLGGMSTVHQFCVLVKHVHHALRPLRPPGRWAPLKVSTAYDLWGGFLAEEAMPPNSGNPQRGQHLQDENCRGAHLDGMITAEE